MAKAKQFVILEETRKCPFCGRDLVKLYMPAPYGLVLDSRKHGFWDDSSYPIKIRSSWRPNWILAQSCVGCNIILISGPPEGLLKKCRKCKSKIPFDSEECKFCGARQSERR